MFHIRMLIAAMLALLAVSTSAHAVDPALAREYQTLDLRIQKLKNDAIALGQDLALLDKGMLSLSGNPLVVYLSTDIDDAFELQAVELELNGNFVSRKEMLPEAVAALQHGGAERFLVKELPAGEYQLKATLVGKIGKGRDHRAFNTLTFTKENNKPKTVELRISNVRERFLPELVMKEWD